MAKLPPLPASSCPLTAKLARSRRAGRMQRAKKSAVLQYTTSNSRNLCKLTMRVAPAGALSEMIRKTGSCAARLCEDVEQNKSLHNAKPTLPDEANGCRQPQP